MTRSRRLSLAVALLVAAPLLGSSLVGCGGFGRGRYARPSGRITYRGEPIRRAYIYFAPTDNGVSASGEVSDGRVVNLTSYVLDDGILPGQYRVALLAYPKPLDQSTSKNAGFQEVAEPVVTTSGRPVPEKFCSVNGSPLIVDIYAGTTDFEFDLKD